MGVNVYDVDLTAKSEEGESTGCVIYFVLLDANIIARGIAERYCLQVVDIK